MKNNIRPSIGGLIVVAVAVSFYFYLSTIRKVPGLLPQQAIIVRPMWSEPLYQAIKDHAPSFQEIFVFAAEISPASNGPEYSVNPIDFDWLSKNAGRVGLMITIDGLPDGADASGALSSCIKDLIAKSTKNGLRPTEILIDYKCPEPQIPKYTQWIAKAKSAAGIPICVLASPAAVRRGTLGDLSKVANSFLLEEDTSTQSQASVIEADVERAARLKVPFRVLLPSYFRPDQTIHTEDPAILAQLMRDWTASHPEMLYGVIWDDLSSDDDPTAVRWSTLSGIMTGSAPVADVQLLVRRLDPKPGQSPLVSEVDLVNKGAADATWNIPVSATWSDADVVDSKSLPGFTQQNTGRRSILFAPDTAHPPTPIRPGEQRAVGWVQLDNDAQVRVEEKR